MLLITLATVTQTYYEFPSTPEDVEQLESALEIQLVDGDLQPLRRVFTFSRITPDGSRLVQIMNGVVNVYQLDADGIAQGTPLQTDNRKLQGQSILQAAVSNSYLAVYLNSSTEISVYVFDLADLTNVEQYARPFLNISVSTTQYNTTKCSGQFSVKDVTRGFLVLLGCPEAEVLTISLSGNASSISTKATGGIIAISSASSTVFAIFPANDSEANRAGLFVQSVDNFIFASANAQFLLRLDRNLLIGSQAEKRFSQEIQVGAGCNVAVRYMHVVSLRDVTALLFSAESTQISGLLMLPDTGRVDAVVDPQIRTIQEIKRTHYDQAAEISQYGVFFSAKDQLSFLSLDKLSQPFPLNGSNISVRLMLTSEISGDAQHVVKLTAPTASLQQSLQLKDQLSIKYDLLRDSSYRDMDFSIFNSVLVAFALSPLYEKSKQIVRFVYLTAPYTAPVASAFSVEYELSDGTYATLTDSVMVGTWMRLTLHTTHAGNCSDFQFTVQGTPALLLNQSITQDAGSCVFKGRAPLKAGSFRLSVDSFGTSVAVAPVDFAATPTPPKSISVVSVKPMIIRIRQNFSIRVQMVDQYANELSASDSVCGALVGRMYQADQTFSNNPYISETKSYDDLTGSAIKIDGAETFHFRLTNDQYCVFNMTSGYPVSKILFAKLFDGENAASEIQLDSDVREALMIPICDYTPSRYKFDALAVVKVILVVLVVALTLFIIPYLAYRCVNPVMPELEKPRGSAAVDDSQVSERIQVASAAAASSLPAPSPNTTNLLPSNSLSEAAPRGLGEVKLRGEPLYKSFVPEVDFDAIELTEQQLALFGTLEPVLQVGNCWRAETSLDANCVVLSQNFFFFGARSVFVALFDSPAHCESYQLQLVLQSRMRIQQLQLLQTSIVTDYTGGAERWQLFEALRQAQRPALVCVYEATADGIAFGSREQCASVREQLAKMGAMRPRRAFRNVRHAVLRAADGRALLGPAKWFGDEYLTAGCQEDDCAADLREIDEIFCDE